MPTINFSAHPYTLENLINAKHTYELVESECTHIYMLIAIIVDLEMLVVDLSWMENTDYIQIIENLLLK